MHKITKIDCQHKHNGMLRINESRLLLLLSVLFDEPRILFRSYYRNMHKSINQSEHIHINSAIRLEQLIHMTPVT